MLQIASNNIIIYEEDNLFKHSYIDLLNICGEYRIHNILSGVILKADKITAFIISLLEDQVSYKILKDKFISLLGLEYFVEDDLTEIITILIDQKFIVIERKRYETKIMLISPCYEYNNEAYRELTISPPLGILEIATSLFNAGYEVKILDMLLNDIRPESLPYYISNFKPDIVGISMNFSSTANICYKVARVVKEQGVNTVFVGGNHSTFTYEKIMQDISIDFVVRYQGEETVLELVNIIQKKKYEDLKHCKGLVYRNKENNREPGMEIVVTERRGQMDLNKLDVPQWHLLQLFKYTGNSRWTLVTSKGCPCSCVFCSTSSFNNEKCISFMSVDKIMGRIEKIISIEGEEKNISISFCDDAFTYNKKRIIELCNRLIERKAKIKWGCSTRVDLVDEDLFRIMYKAGCRAVLFGIESCSNEVLKLVGKKINIEQAKKAIKIAKKIGMTINEMFIIGLPYESYETLKLIQDFFIKTKPQEIRFGFLSVYPRTPIWNEREKYGIDVLTDNWGDYDLLRPTSSNRKMSSDELYEAYINFTEQNELMNK